MFKLKEYTRYGQAEDRYKNHGKKPRGFTDIRVV